eukprot:11000915-Alexandrium_andersonii.AAC.1
MPDTDPPMPSPGKPTGVVSDWGDGGLSASGLAGAGWSATSSGLFGMGVESSESESKPGLPSLP